MSVNDRELEIRRAETDVATLEGNVASELARMSSAAGEIQARLQGLKATVATMRGIQDPAVQELSQRLERAAMPQLSVEAQRAQALQARAEAVAARKRLSEQMWQAVQRYAAELSRLSSQVAADEAALEAIDQRARQAAPPKAKPAAPVPPPLPKPEGRRQQPRVRMQAVIDLHSDSNFYFTGFSTNLSEGGLFVATTQQVPIGTEVDVQFSLPGGERIEVRGVVRWTREVNDNAPDVFPGLGVQFVSLPPNAGAVIQRFVASREPMFYAE